jgi:hypothetical protein
LVSQVFGLNWMFKPEIENTGNTQTENLEVFVTSAFALDEINDEPVTHPRKGPAFAPRDPEDAYREQGKVFPAFRRIPLAAHSSIPVGGEGPTIKWVDQMAQNRSDGYVSGVIWYNDVFLRSERHVSKFCFIIQPVKSGDQPTRITYGICSYWNCMGRDECAEQKKEYDDELQAIRKPPPAPASK